MAAFGTIAENLATAYTAAQLPATPSGAKAIRSSSANAPNDLPATPCVLVFLDSVVFKAGNGEREGHGTWFVRLYYDQVPGGDLERDSDQLRDWLSLFVDQLKTRVQLSGTVVRCAVIGARIGILRYAGNSYSGLELVVETVHSEPWLAVA